ncbi:MAG: S-methyl-5'-thioadenosine phosphorylase, partial [Gammaproteobacteria bacterium]
MKTTAIIGGSGLTQIESINITDEQLYITPYGDPSAACILGELDGQKVIFLARHGDPHTIAPHKINYRANIWALKQA